MIVEPHPTIAGLPAARAVARHRGHPDVGIEHLFHVWLRDREPSLERLIERYQVDRRRLADLVSRVLSELEEGSGSGPLAPAPTALRLLQRAQDRARTNRAVPVGVFLQCLLDDQSLAFSRVLRSAGLRSRMADVSDLSAPSVRLVETEANDTARGPLRFVRDLTDEARRGRLEPVVGRDRELRALRAILCQKRVPNALVVGPAGVGKTALAEAMADEVQREGRDRLGIERVLELDLAAILGGADQRGAVEKRFRELLDAIECEDRSTLLFIDEAHSLMGAGGGVGGPDLANLFKPALARGDLRVMAATTDDEFTSSIERDGALRRRFQVLRVDEPADGALARIIKRCIPSYEEHHSVRIPAQLGADLVQFSREHQPDRHNPHKALQLLDLACATVRLDAGQDVIPVLSRKDLGRAISEQAGIPTGRILGFSAESLASMEDAWKQLCGLEPATQLALREVIEKASLGEAPRPGPWLKVGLLGPAGGDLDRLPGLLADQLAGCADRHFRVSLMQCTDRHGVDRLIGSAPGLVGYEDGGQLTEPVRRDPYRLVVVDGGGDTHPAAVGLVADLLSCATIKDGRGRKVAFRQALVVVRCLPGRIEPELLSLCDLVIDEQGRVPS